MNSNLPEGANNIEREKRRQRLRRPQLGMALFNACLGLIAFFNVAGKPRFATYHTLDVARLVIAGAGFGVALVLLIQFFGFGMWKDQEEHHSSTNSETPKK